MQTANSAISELLEREKKAREEADRKAREYEILVSSVFVSGRALVVRPAYTLFYLDRDNPNPSLDFRFRYAHFPILRIYAHISIITFELCDAADGKVIGFNKQTYDYFGYVCSFFFNCVDCVW